MKYGAKGYRWAPITAEPAGSLPTYGGAVVLGELNQVVDNPTYNEAKGYGDNALRRHVVKFKECGIDVAILDMTNANAAAVFGTEVPTTAAKDLHFNESDNPPYGGAAFYINELLEDNKDVFKCVFYPKQKATMQGETYDTTGESITLTNKKIHFTGSTANNGDWKIESDYFDTEEAAIAWLDEKLPLAAAATTSTEGTATA